MAQASDFDDVIILSEALVGRTFDLGAGNDTLTMTAAAGMTNAAIIGGAGQKYVTIEAAGEAGLKESSIRTADKDDVIRVSSVTGTGVLSNSTIDAGEGHNTIFVSGKRGMETGSTIKTGAGDDSITIVSTSGTAVIGSRVLVGAGDNTISINGSAWGLHSSDVIAGNGNDLITIAAPTRAALGEDSHINAGDGDNTITLSGAYGMEMESSVATGSGNDSISVTSTTGLAMQDSRIEAGNGNNTVMIDSRTSGMSDSGIVTGLDNDSISVSGVTAALEGNSSIVSGAGNDSIKVSAFGSAMRGTSRIDAGDGNDTVEISGLLNGSEGGVRIHMGDGNDMIRLDRPEGGIVSGDVVLNGGTNDDLNFAAGKLGDVLSLSTGLSLSTDLGGISSAVAVGFETLHLNLANGAVNIFDVPDMLHTLAGKGFHGIQGFSGIVLTGNTLDSVHFDKAVLYPGTVTPEGFGGQAFARYTVVNDHNETVNIFVQSGVEVQGDITVPREPELPGEGSHEGSGDDRFVLYTGDLEGNINGKAVQGYVIINDDDRHAALISVSACTYGVATIDTHGRITYTLADNAYSRFPDTSAGALTDTFTYTARTTSGTLYTKTVEVVIVRDATGKELYFSDNTVQGETHYNHVDLIGDNDSRTVEILGSGSHDTFTSIRTIRNADIDLLGGNNTATFSVDDATALSNNTHIATGGGEDDIRVNGYAGLYNNSSINAGDGYNRVIIDTVYDGVSGLEVRKSGGAYANGNYYNGGSSIVAGNGNDTISMTSQSGALLSYSSFIDAGHGDNVVTLRNENYWQAGMYANSGIRTGDGNSTISIASSLHALNDHSYIKLGNGNNTVSLTANQYVIAGSSSITAGNGANVISLSGAGNGMLDSTITAGDGGNTIRVGSNGGTALTGSTITTGAGGDTITLTGAGHGLFSGSKIIAGGGHNSVSVFMDGYGVYENSHITAGSGDDTITISGSGGMMYGCSLAAGDGNNRIAIASSAADWALYTSSITTGVGHDSITVSGGYGMGGDGTVNAKGSYANGTYYSNGSFIRTGDGDDTVAVSSSVGMAMQYSSYVDAGGGNNVIRVEREGYDAGIAYNSGILSGSGDDNIFVSSWIQALYGNSYIKAGEGNNTITVASTVADGRYAAVEKACTITAGAGNDTITVASQGNGVQASSINAGEGANSISVEAVNGSALYDASSITSGNGNDTITLTGAGHGISSGSKITAGGGHNSISVVMDGYGVYDNSHITAGAGNDTITISGSGGMMYGCSLAAGDGNNRIDVASSAVDWALYTSSITTGVGHDNITVSGGYGMGGDGTVTAKGSYANGTYYSNGSFIRSGDGDDTVTVSSSVGMLMEYGSYVDAGNGNNVIRMENHGYDAGIAYNSGILAGNGDDNIFVSSWVEALYGNSYIKAGEGNNTITVINTGFDSRIAAIENASAITAGAGNDHITIASQGNGICASSINAGNGDNYISVEAVEGTALYGVSSITTGTGADKLTISGAYGVLDNSSINTGAGSDTISITATDASYYALHDSILRTVDGDDVVHIRGAAWAMGGSAQVLTGNGADTVHITGNLAGTAKIDLGAGDDYLSLHQSQAGGGILMHEGATLLGGTNDTVDFSHGKTGDVLGVHWQQVFSDEFGGLTNLNTKGFETLHVDLLDSHADNLDLGRLLDTLSTQGFKGTSAFGGLVITGDASDTLTHMGNATLAQSGVSLNNSAFTGETFDHYTLRVGSKDLELFIQNTLITG